MYPKKKLFDPSQFDWLSYFSKQFGGRGRFIGTRHQRGMGIKGRGFLFSWKGPSTIATRLIPNMLETGKQVVGDILKGRNVIQTLNQRGEEGFKKLMSGKSIKRRTPSTKVIRKKRDDSERSLPF